MASPGDRGGDADGASDDELEITLPSDSVPAALDKTKTDQEHDISFMVEEARASAMAGNFFKAESLLKRVCKLTSRLHGAASLELAAHHSKQSAIQETSGKAIESKLSWNRALYIFEINRAPSPDPQSSSSAKNRSKQRRAIKREMIKMGAHKAKKGGKDAGQSGLAKDKPTENAAIAKAALKKAENQMKMQSSKTKTQRMNVEPKKRRQKLIPLQALYKIPHWSMQSADAAIINTTHIHTDDLTPRTRQAIIGVA